MCLKLRKIMLWKLVHGTRRKPSFSACGIYTLLTKVNFSHLMVHNGHRRLTDRLPLYHHTIYEYVDICERFAFSSTELLVHDLGGHNLLRARKHGFLHTKMNGAHVSCVVCCHSTRRFSVSDVEEAFHEHSSNNHVSYPHIPPRFYFVFPFLIFWNG